MKLFRNTKRNAEVPTASMADVAFLLITFFMLTSAIAMTRGIFFKVPEQASQPPDSQEKNPAIYIFVDPAGNLFIDKKPSRLEEIKPYCKSRLLINENKPVIIHCSAEQSYQKMMEVFDQLKVLESDLWGDFNKDKSESAKKRLKITIPSLEEAALYQE